MEKITTDRSAATARRAGPDPSTPDAGAASSGLDASLAAVPLAAFLDEVAGVLRNGLPARLWVAATVLAARASAAGHTLELADPDAGQAATLRVFLPNSALAAIRRDLGIPLDPVLLVGLTTALRVAPSFTRRWHMGGRVEALSRDAAASLRVRLRERTVATLKREGLWDRQRSLPRPRDVTRVAVVHPAGAAGWGDIAGELARWQAAGLLRVRSCPAPFEGNRAESALATALRAAAEPLDGHRPDLVLVVRGGGARASLAVLDEEAVARAVLACPVPVVTGTGHAQDSTLADMVAWRAVDTPSKALALVAELIRVAAGAARADWRTIVGTALTALLTHAGQLDARRHAGLAAASQAVAAADRQLLQLWGGVRGELRAGAGRVLLLDAELDRVLAAMRERAPRLLEASGQALEQVLQAGLARATGLLGRADTGAALLGQTLARAGAVLEREGAGLRQVRGTVEDAAARQLEREAAALDQLLALAEAGDLGSMLARGLVAVTDETGRLVPTRAEAATQGRLLLRFGDGVLAVVPID